MVIGIAVDAKVMDVKAAAVSAKIEALQKELDLM